MEFLFIKKLFKFVICYFAILLGIHDIFQNNRIEEKVLLKIVIDRINVDESVYNINSVLNHVDYHVEILEHSNLDKNLFYLAAHSGSGSKCYFNDLILLEKGDIIFIFIGHDKLCFVVEELFYIEKEGYFEVLSQIQSNYLFLITCSLDYDNKQLIVKSRLI